MNCDETTPGGENSGKEKAKVMLIPCQREKKKKTFRGAKDFAKNFALGLYEGGGGGMLTLQCCPSPYKQSTGRNGRSLELRFPLLSR